MYIVNTKHVKNFDKVKVIMSEMAETYQDQYYVETFYGGTNVGVLDILLPMAALVGLIMLFMMTKAYIEPLFILISIAVAVLINMGSNIIFESVSEMTFSIAAVLQLVLSIDYSIMLIHRFEQEYKALEVKDACLAMKNAIVNAIQNAEAVPVEYLKKIGRAVDPYFVQGKRSADLNVAKRYNPAKGEQMRAVRGINEAFAPFLDSHRVMPYRAQTVAYKLLRYYVEYVQGITDALILKAHGAGAEARRVYESFMAEFGKRECEIELWYDQAMCGQAWKFGVFDKPEANLPGAQTLTPTTADDGDVTTANE